MCTPTMPKGKAVPEKGKKVGRQQKSRLPGMHTGPGEWVRVQVITLVVSVSQFLSRRDHLLTHAAINSVM